MLPDYSCKVRSPSRVDLSGGTLDCWPLYLYFPPVSTVNVSINIYTEVELIVQKEGICIEFPDLNKKYSFSSVEECLKSTDKHLSLLQEQLKLWKPKPNIYFKVIMKSESPLGGGLGASSSLCISLIKIFQDFSQNNFCITKVKDILKTSEEKLSAKEMLNLASNLEATVLKMPTGTQDYFPAITPGLHIIDYSVAGFVDNVLQASYLDHLSKHLVLVYTGQPHHSGISNWQVIKDYLDGSKNSSVVLQGLADLSQDMKNLLYQLDKEEVVDFNSTEEHFSQIPKLFTKELKLRKKLNAKFVTKDIENLRSLALQHGGVEIKICGAGSGGCVLVWVTAEKKALLQENLIKNQYKVLDFSFVNKK